MLATIVHRRPSPSSRRNPQRAGNAGFPTSSSLVLGTSIRRPRVAVVGAGAAGLVTARELLRVGATVSIFETGEQPGGLWNYRDAVDSDPLSQDPNRRREHASLYASLRTNLPRRLMAFRDFPFDDPDPCESWAEFPSHRVVQRYLWRFARHYGLARHISFSAEVCGIRRWASGWQLSVRGRPSQWFDAVAVCNGHYGEPWTPELPGLEEFPGLCLHSHNYRRPAAFAGQHVVLVGGRASGVDLAHELLPHAKSVRLCASQPADVLVDHRVEVFPSAVALGPGSSVTVAGGQRLADVDVLVFCTGYRYWFPFLEVGLVRAGRGWVRPLYLDLFHATFPSLAFIGLPFKVVPFPQFEIQAKFFARVVTGAYQLPTLAARRALSRTRARQQPLPSRFELCHDERQFSYYNELARCLKLACLPNWFAPLYAAVAEQRQHDPIGYRDTFP